MNFYKLIIQNLVNLPLMCFLLGGIVGFIKPSLKLPRLLKNLLTISILFFIGLKGGAPLFEHTQAISYTFFALVCCLVIYSLIQPMISFHILKAVTKIDH
jgi:hypothetical protein